MLVGGPVHGVHVGARRVTAAWCPASGEVAPVALSLARTPVPVPLGRVGDPVPVWTADGPAAAADLLAAHLSDVLPDTGSAALVLAVPADWRGHRRAALTRSLAAAGLPAVTVVGSPVAVAAQVAADDPRSRPGLFAVLEVGDRDTSAAVVRVDGGTVEELVPATAPLPWGLHDAEDAVLALVRDQLSAPVLAADATALRDACRRAAHDLCASPETTVDTADLPVRVLRTEWEELLGSGADAVVEHLRRALQLAGTGVGDLTAVVVTGPGAQLPSLVAAVADDLDVVPRVPADPETVAARGAAVLARGVADRAEAERSRRAAAADGPDAAGAEGVDEDPGTRAPDRRRHRAETGHRRAGRAHARRRLTVVVLLAVSLVLGGTSLVAALNADATAQAGLPGAPETSAPAAPAPSDVPPAPGAPEPGTPQP